MEKTEDGVLQVSGEKRNSSIDIFRYVCAIMVVIVHAHPGAEIDSWGRWEWLVGFFTETLPSIAVPFFFAVAGYFYTKALVSGKKIFMTYFKKLVKTYVFWSVIYFVLDLFNTIVNGNAVLPFLKGCVFSFFFAGSYYHFWFFPALIISVCMFTAMYKCKLTKAIIPVTLVLYVVKCLYSINADIPLLTNLLNIPTFDVFKNIFLTGFPLFTSGYLVYRLREKYAFTNKKLLVGWGIYVVIYFGGKCILYLCEIQRGWFATLGLYLFTVMIMLSLLNNPMPRLYQISQKCRILANFTYYSHPLFITLLKLQSKITNFTIPPTVQFFITIAITFILGMVCYQCSKGKGKLIKLIAG